MTQPLAGAKSVGTENELDIRGLFRVLWQGKLWIVGIALGFALLALAYTFFAKQEWSATAITDKPTVNMLGGFYSQQQFLRNLDIKANLATPDQVSVMDEAYKEFVMQLASWDTRRDFWSQTDYYKQRRVDNTKADAALLDDLINNIQFMPIVVTGRIAPSFIYFVKLTIRPRQRIPDPSGCFSCLLTNHKLHSASTPFTGSHLIFP